MMTYSKPLASLIGCWGLSVATTDIVHKSSVSYPMAKAGGFRRILAYARVASIVLHNQVGVA